MKKIETLGGRTVLATVMFTGYTGYVVPVKADVSSHIQSGAAVLESLCGNRTNAPSFMARQAMNTVKEKAYLDVMRDALDQFGEQCHVCEKTMTWMVTQIQKQMDQSKFKFVVESVLPLRPLPKARNCCTITGSGKYQTEPLYSGTGRTREIRIIGDHIMILVKNQPVQGTAAA